MEKEKYQLALEAHPLKLTDNQVKEKVESLLTQKTAENKTKQVYSHIYGCIDLTSLNSTDTQEGIWKFVEGVNQSEGTHPDVPNVAAICVHPNFANTVKDTLTADVRIACVSGGFPTSQTFPEVKVAETALAVADGAEEIDVVINLGLFLGNEYEEMSSELMEIKEACREAKLKVILETGALQSAEQIHNASILALYSGADFLKTSTGKGYPGATPEAAYIMCNAIKSYYKKTGRKVGFKASGGVSTPEEAVKYYTIVKEVLGSGWCNNNLFRIGTSKLADILLKQIKKA